jgi:tetratricopeptide (TPR) repeat protein
VLDQAKGWIEELDDERLRARATVVAVLLGAHRGDLEADAGAEQAIGSAIEVFSRATDEHGSAQAYTMLADLHMDAGHFAAAVDDLERALPHARAARSPRDEATILSWLASALFWGPSPATEALDRCERIRSEASGSPAAEAKAKLILAGLRGLVGDFQVARSLFGEGAATLAELGLNVSLATGRQLSGMIESLAGDEGAAEAQLRIGYEALVEMGQLGFAVGAAAFLGRTLAAQRRFEEVAALAAFMDETAPADDSVAQAHLRMLEARVAAAVGDPSAVENARIAVAGIEPIDDLRTRGDLSLDLAEVLKALGQDARPALEGALELYKRKGVSPRVDAVTGLLTG